LALDGKGYALHKGFLAQLTYLEILAHLRSAESS